MLTNAGNMHLVAAAGNTLGVACVLVSSLHLDPVACIWPSCNYGGVCEDPPIRNTSVTVSVLTSAGLTCTFFWQAGAASVPPTTTPQPLPSGPTPSMCTTFRSLFTNTTPKCQDAPVTWAHLWFFLPLVVCLKNRTNSQFQITNSN